MTFEFIILGRSISLTKDEVQQWQREGKMWILKDGLVNKGQLGQLRYLSNTRHYKKQKRPSTWKPYPEWTAYRTLVHSLTRKQPIHTLANYEKRGWRAYHLDHKISIWHGFENGMTAESIAHISNLHFIPWQENLKKGVSCNFAR